MESSGDSAGARAALAHAAQSNPSDARALTAYAEFLDRYGDPAAREAYSKLLAQLRTLPGVSEVRGTDHVATDVYADRGGQLISAIVNSAQASGVELRDVHISEPSLETLFLHHTGRSLRD